MKKNKIINNFLVLFFLISTAQIGMPPEDEYQNLRVRVFRILPFQGSVKSYPAKEGGIRGVVSGGNVTAFFPDGIVLLETDLYQNDEDLVRFIKEKVKFSGLGEKVKISKVEHSNHTITKDRYIAIKENEEGKAVHLTRYGQYLLSIRPLSIEGRREVILSVEFRNHEKLLDQTIGVRFSKTLIIGFPTNEKGSRGTVYWLALSFED